MTDEEGSLIDKITLDVSETTPWAVAVYKAAAPQRHTQKGIETVYRKQGSTKDIGTASTAVPIQ